MNNGYSLALDFHENTKYLGQALVYDENTQYKIYPNARVIHLEGCAADSSDSFIKAILSRKSTRTFNVKVFL